ncbi:MULTISPECIES: MerR family transcriptional regulator [unclassified Nocardiopsis]|uniref:MerR family transcriptional regulator n=1 Tax=Nocardiopsis TaxID=2013 RepID=UPI00387ABB0D
MRIGDAAAAAGTTPRALRFYEQRGLLPPPRRTASGQRDYGPEDVSRVRLIRDLLDSGLTVADLAAIAHRLALLDAPDTPPCRGGGEGTAVVRRRLAALDGEIARLNTLRERLADRTGVPGGEGPTPGPPPAPPSE